MDTSIRRHVTELEAILSRWDVPERVLIDAGDPQGDGGFYQRERIEAGAHWACSYFPGDLVEIGCLNGSTTIRLAHIARRWGRRVIAIDPFEAGTQNVSADTFEIFTRTIAPYADVIDFMRLRSDDPRVIETLKARELAFVFVDGLHEFDTALGDLRAVKHARLIALDDTRTIAEVNRAFYEFWVIAEREDGRIPIAYEYWRESWIV